MKPLYKKYAFENFKDAYNFVQRLALEFEKMNHHPDVKFGWGYVEVWSISHDEQKVTERDRKIMAIIDDLYED